MSAAALLFWCMAAAKVLLSAPVQIRAAQSRMPQHLRLASSQRKDDWLAMVIMVLALLLDPYPLSGWAYLQMREAMAQVLNATPNFAGWMYLIGTITLTWLVQRTLKRLGALRHR